MEIKAWTCWGSVRGWCGKRHETEDQADAHMTADSRGCRKQGGYSDRAVYAVDEEGYAREGDWYVYPFGLTHPALKLAGS